MLNEVQHHYSAKSRARESEIMFGIPLRFWRELGKLSEKTIEVNYLAELYNRVSHIFRFTIIGPSRTIEHKVGFDAMLSCLPPGHVFALQFKGPSERKDGHARFTINVPQLQVLLDRFRPRQAFYVLLPYTRTAQFITAHQNGNFLGQTRLLDVYDIPLGRKTAQKSRTIKFIDINHIRVTDPWNYMNIEKTYGFEELMALLKEKSIGKKVPIEIEEDTQRKKREYGGQNFYVHFRDLE